ncbi:MAG TPA: GNAT family N-acetyltransferase [Burkholderiales bacterium]|nr:GNAT family N-acetyltransferase [Burkholderiales bacterium]
MRPQSAAITVRRAGWTGDNRLLRAIREEVFVREQGVPAELEWDEFDAVSQHVIAWAGSSAVGTGRLLPDGHIGRMAVLAAWRGRGAGSALLMALMDLARAAGMRHVELNAQTRALGFYARHGFRAEGEEFDDAGIPHRRMWREL